MKATKRALLTTIVGDDMGFPIDDSDQDDDLLAMAIEGLLDKIKELENHNHSII